MKDNFIKDLEIKLSLKGLDKDEIETVIQCAISALDNYEVTARTTELTVRYEDTNERILKRYVACLRLDGKSERTIKMYLYSLKRLSEQAKKPFTEMSTNDIRFFLSVLMEKGKKSYVNSQKCYISGFFKWMTEEELIAKNPCARINNIKVEDEVRLPFSSIEIDRLRSSITGRNVLRDRAIVETLLSSGVRCSELCNLTRGDLNASDRSLLVRCGKGGKDRKTFVSELAMEYIVKYLNKRKDDDPHLFMGQRGDLGIDGVQDMLRRLGKIAKVKNVHPHRFRRTFATTMYRRGMELEELRRLMGHTEIQTTLRYIYTDDTRLKASYEKYVA